MMAVAAAMGFVRMENEWELENHQDGNNAKAHAILNKCMLLVYGRRRRRVFIKKVFLRSTMMIVRWRPR